MTLTHLAHLSDRAWAFQEHRVRQTLAKPMTRSACVEPLTEAQLAERVWSATKASHMRAAALRNKSLESRSLDGDRLLEVQRAVRLEDRASGDAPSVSRPSRAEIKPPIAGSEPADSHQPGQPGTSALVRKARLETHRQLRLVES